MPLVNLIAVPVLAFSGNSPTKKNYYRAIPAWLAVIVGLNGTLLAAGFWPVIVKEVKMVMTKKSSRRPDARR
jgi:hypothetical protein